MLTNDWHLDALRAELGARYPGFGVELRDEVDSTSAELMRRARAGQAEPTLLVAERQSAGRGRLGRPWDSTAGTSLTFSLGLPLAPRDWSGLSLAVGVAIAQALDPDDAAGLRIKWPNDLWRDGRKLSGILIETAMPQGDVQAARYAVVGVGINIGGRDAAGLRFAPAWVREWQPEASAAGVLRAVAPALLDALRRFEAQGFTAFAEAFAARDALRGREVQLSDGSGGRCAGVGASGELLVETAEGMQIVTSAEVSVRPL